MTTTPQPPAEQPTPAAPELLEPTWEQRVADLAADPKHDLAPLMGGGRPVIVGGVRRLYPWLLRGDVTALLMWAEQLQEHPAAAHIAPGPDGGSTITVTGMLLGKHVELVAVTHHPVPRISGDGLVAWDVMFELAALEDVIVFAAGSPVQA